MTARGDMQRGVVAGALFLACAVLPLLVVGPESPLIRPGLGPSNLPFELFGLSVGLTVLASGWVRREALTRALAADPRLFLPLAVGMFLLFLVTDQSGSPWDYHCYESAARLIAAGQSPYQDPCYHYPPFLARVLAGIHLVVGRIAAPGAPAESTWWLTYYLYRVGLFGSALIAMTLLYRLGGRIGLDRGAAWMAASLPFVGAVPLLRTFSMNQVNFATVALLAGALLCRGSRPLLAGALIVASLLIKPQALLLLPLLVVHRAWRVGAGVLLAVLPYAVLQLGVQLSEGELLAYPSTLKPITAYNDYLRNNSWNSLFQNTWRLLGQPGSPGLISGLLLGTYILLGAGFLGRAWQREGRRRAGWEGSRVFFSGFTDALCFGLLLSPMVWPHHFAVLTPVLLVALVTRISRRPHLLWIGTVMIALPPVFDVYPWSYHRLVGLVLVTVALGPGQLRSQTIVP